MVFIMFMTIGLVRSGISDVSGCRCVVLVLARALSMKLMPSVDVAPLLVT